LEHALKLLILVHVGGDVGVREDEHSLRIVKNYMPGYNGCKVTPCFIRAQLGPVFSRIASKLMRQVLTELEILSPSQNRSHFPMVVGTFSVLFMTMESLQHHLAKLPYHTHHDNPQPLRDLEQDPSMTRNMDELDGADILLRFYKATACHAQLKRIADLNPLPSSLTAFDVDPTGFLTDLKRAVESARDYLDERLRIKTVPMADTSGFFDRLLAKMYMLGPMEI
jgi:hypothetical protein